MVLLATLLAVGVEAPAVAVAEAELGAQEDIGEGEVGAVVGVETVEGILGGIEVALLLL